MVLYLTRVFHRVSPRFTVKTMDQLCSQCHKSKDDDDDDEEWGVCYTCKRMFCESCDWVGLTVECDSEDICKYECIFNRKNYTPAEIKRHEIKQTKFEADFVKKHLDREDNTDDWFGLVEKARRLPKYPCICEKSVKIARADLINNPTGEFDLCYDCIGQEDKRSRNAFIARRVGFMCGNVVYGESTSESSYQSSSDDEELDQKDEELDQEDDKLDQEDDKLHVNHIQCEGVLTIDEISVGNEAVQINHFNISDTPARIKRVRAENSGTQVNTF